MIPRPSAPRLTLGGMNGDDDAPRPRDHRTRLVAMVLVVVLILGVAPFLLALFV